MQSVSYVQECAAQNSAKGVKELECLPPGGNYGRSRRRESCRLEEGRARTALGGRTGERAEGSIVKPRREAVTPIPGVAPRTVVLFLREK